MEVSSSHQMYVFLLCVLLGLGCGVFFDFQRCVRKKFFAGILRTTLEDILFATLCIGAVIALGFFFNNGEIRYYQILGSVSGALFYAAFLSKLVSKIFLFFFGITEKIIVKPFLWLCKTVIIPFRYLRDALKKLCKGFKRLSARASKALRNRLKMLKKRIKML